MFLHEKSDRFVTQCSFSLWLFALTGLRTMIIYILFAYFTTKKIKLYILANFGFKNSVKFSYEFTRYVCVLDPQTAAIATSTSRYHSQDPFAINILLSWVKYDILYITCRYALNNFCTFYTISENMIILFLSKKNRRENKFFTCRQFFR